MARALRMSALPFNRSYHSARLFPIPAPRFELRLATPRAEPQDVDVTGPHTSGDQLSAVCLN